VRPRGSSRPGSAEPGAISVACLGIQVIVNMDGYNFYIERLSDNPDWTLLTLDLETEVDE